MTGGLSPRCPPQVSHVMRPENWRLVEDAKIVYSAGFFMTTSPDTIKLVSEHCSKSSAIYCLVRHRPHPARRRRCEYVPGIVGRGNT